MSEWNLVDAKDRFNELVNLVLAKEPQHVNLDMDTIIMITVQEYERLKGKRSGFKDYLMQGESFEGINIERAPGLSRDIKLCR